MTTLDDRYVLGDRIGGGATADVYRAHDLRLGRDVAVKVFRRASALPDARGRLESEVRLLAGLSHPNLVALYDAEVGDEPYVVMELVEGPSLHEVLTRGPVDARRAARLGAEVAAALAYVHSRGVVHRDVKPGNVLLTADGHAKVADFGIARIVEDPGMTQAGLVVGTAAYLAPEQVRGQQVTTAADVYSLGLVLLEALTGRREYDGPATEAAGARLHRAPTIPASLGSRWTSLLAAMTASEPADRPDAVEVSRRLRPEGTGPTAATRAIATSPATTVLPPVVVPYDPEPQDPEPPRRRGWLIAAVVLGLLAAAAIAVAVVLAARHTSTPTDVPSTTGSVSSPSATPTTSAPPAASSTPATSSSPPAPTTTAPSPTPTPTTPSSSSSAPTSATTAASSSSTTPSSGLTSSTPPAS